MTERLLQFIWQFQYFNKNELQTTAGEPATILFPGKFNMHQGPDFLEARIRIGNAIWVGNVELHLRAADWIKHAHHEDPNYDNVILHVVWEDNEESTLPGIPVLLLQDRIFKLLLLQYERWMNSRDFIPCAQHIHLASGMIWTSWQERLLIERLERKCGQVAEYLRRNNQHWEETFWWMLARNFGLYVNAEAFEEMAVSIPFALLSKHRNQIHQLEALLLGQAGLLEGEGNSNHQLMLQKEYRFYAKKYQLEKVRAPALFLRMRPMAFPTVRLAILAMLVHTSQWLFTTIREAENVKEIRRMLNVTASDFWHYHYTFDERSAYRPKTLGSQMADNIIINTVIPILFAYARYRKDEDRLQQLVGWLKTLPRERNSIVLQFGKLGIESRSALDSQSFLELKTQYCDRRRCLDCAIGNAILKRSV